MTRQDAYWEVFIQTLEFVETKQVDWKWGEWHGTVNEQGPVEGVKGNAWKGSYHNGRAMLECLEVLKRLK